MGSCPMKSIVLGKQQKDIIGDIKENKKVYNPHQERNLGCWKMDQTSRT